MKNFFKKVFRIVFRILIGFIVLSVLSVIMFRWVPVPVTPLMLIRSFEQKNFSYKKEWVPLENISPHLQLAVVCSEDQNFLNHYGFDLNAIEKAMDRNKSSKKKIRGASTISQQTAKNVFLWPSRSWIRKGFEVYFTLLIETFWSKERIMEVYLNIIETGKGVYGAEASANYFFNKQAKKLTVSESALIAALLPNPRVYNGKSPSAYVRSRQGWVMHQMKLWGGKLIFKNEKQDSDKK